MIQTVNDLITNNYTGPFVFFYGHKVTPGKITETCCSQWYPCRFKDESHEYNCMEQYMMFHKAKLMKDLESQIKIMQSSDPKEIKALGRLVKNFNPELWNKHKQEIVIKGNLLKFGQNSELKKFLLNTSGILVEASPWDKIWGIGCRKTWKAAQDPKTWKGENLLGFALTYVREKLQCE